MWLQSWHYNGRGSSTPRAEASAEAAPAAAASAEAAPPAAAAAPAAAADPSAAAAPSAAATAPQEATPPAAATAQPIWTRKDAEVFKKVILTPTWQRYLIRLIRFCTRTCPMMGEIPSFSCSNYYLQFNTVNFIANNTCFNKPAVSGCNIDCSNKLSILDI